MFEHLAMLDFLDRLPCSHAFERVNENTTLDIRILKFLLRNYLRKQFDVRQPEDRSLGQNRRAAEDE